MNTLCDNIAYSDTAGVDTKFLVEALYKLPHAQIDGTSYIVYKHFSTVLKQWSKVKGVAYSAYNRSITAVLNSDPLLLLGKDRKPLFGAAYCDVEHYDQLVAVYKMVQILSTLPVPTCTEEIVYFNGSYLESRIVIDFQTLRGFKFVSCGLKDESGNVSSFFIPAIDLVRRFSQMAEYLKYPCLPEHSKSGTCAGRLRHRIPLEIEANILNCARLEAGVFIPEDNSSQLITCHSVLIHSQDFKDALFATEARTSEIIQDTPILKMAKNKVKDLQQQKVIKTSKESVKEVLKEGEKLDEKLKTGTFAKTVTKVQLYELRKDRSDKLVEREKKVKNTNVKAHNMGNKMLTTTKAKNDESSRSRGNKTRHLTLMQNIIGEINDILNQNLEYGPYSEESKLHSLVCNRSAAGYACGDHLFLHHGNRSSMKKPPEDKDSLYEGFKLPYNRDLLCRKGLRLGLRKGPEIETLNYSQQFWWRILQDRHIKFLFECQGKPKERPRKKRSLYGKGSKNSACVTDAKQAEDSSESLDRDEKDKKVEGNPGKKSDETGVSNDNKNNIPTLPLDCSEERCKYTNEDNEYNDRICPNKPSLRSPNSIDELPLRFRTSPCFDPETGESRSGHVCFTRPVHCVRSYIEKGGLKHVLLKVIGELFSVKCTKKCRIFYNVIKSVIPESILMCDYDDVYVLAQIPIDSKVVAHSGDPIVELDALAKHWPKIEDAMGEFHENKKYKTSYLCKY